MLSFVDVVKQYPGLVQVTRKVRVQVPGKHFPSLQPTEQGLHYWGEAVEFAERHKFERHAKAWGAAHHGPGIRFICDSDAVDDPDHRGFWTTLTLFNKWRHETYKDKRELELQYLDERPAPAAGATNADAVKKARAAPEIKDHFILEYTTQHTFSGSGKLGGTTATAFWYSCVRRNPSNRLKGGSCHLRAPPQIYIYLV